MEPTIFDFIKGSRFPHRKRFFALVGILYSYNAFYIEWCHGLCWSHEGHH